MPAIDSARAAAYAAADPMIPPPTTATSTCCSSRLIALATAIALAAGRRAQRPAACTVALSLDHGADGAAIRDAASLIVERITISMRTRASLMPPVRRDFYF